MSQTDRSAMNVYFVKTNVECFSICQHDYAEGLIKFPQSNVIRAKLEKRRQ